MATMAQESETVGREGAEHGSAERQSVEREGAEYERAEFRELMASVGYLMFHWTLLDRAVLNQIRRLRMSEGEQITTSMKVRGTFSERLAEWQALISQRNRRNMRVGNRLSELSSQAERLNRKRKLITQHFSGASDGDGGEPAIFYSEGGVATARDAHARLTQRELSALIAEVRECCAGIEALGGVM